MMHRNARTTVTVIGAGPAGFALAAELGKNGTSVLVYSHPDHLKHASAVIDKGYLRSTGVIEGGFSDLRITTDISEAVAFSKIMVLAVPSTAQEDILRVLEGQDLRRHTIVAVPGNLFSLLIPDALKRVANIFETNLSPYSCRMQDDGTLIVLGKKKSIFIAALKNPSPDDVAFMHGLFPDMDLRWCSSVVEVSLHNVNGIFHPLMMLMNAGRIENADDGFFLYRDGLTPAVARGMEAMDRVRVEIGCRLGLEMALRSSVDISNLCYRQDFGDFVTLARESPPHNRLRAPTTLHHRNVTEDVPDLLVPWLGLAEALGVDAQPLEAVILMADLALGADYRRTGRNLQRLHLDRLSKKELIARFGPFAPLKASEERESQKGIMTVGGRRLKVLQERVTPLE